MRDRMIRGTVPQCSLESHRRMMILARKRLKTEVVVDILLAFMGQRLRHELAHYLPSHCGLDTIDFKETCLC